MENSRYRTITLIANAIFLFIPIAFGQESRVFLENANKACFDYLNAGDLSSARRPCTEAVRIAESISGDLAPLAKSLSNVGTMHLRLGE